MKIHKGRIASELQLLIDGVNSKEQAIEEIAAYIRWREEQLATPAVNVVREPKASSAVCPKCGCNKITGDGSKNWCLNSECDFVEAN